MIAIAIVPLISHVNCLAIHHTHTRYAINFNTFNCPHVARHIFTARNCSGPKHMFCLNIQDHFLPSSQ